MAGTPLQSPRRSRGEDIAIVEGSPGDEIVDLELLEDPEGAFDRLYEEFAPRLRGLALRFRHTADLAEDLVQEVLLRAYRAEVHLDAGRNPWPWLSTVCRNLAIDAGRRRDVRGERSVDSDVLARLPAPAELLEDPEATTVMLGGDIAEALAQLDERQRRMLILKHVRGWKYEEIAEWEDISFPALRSALSRARQKFTETYAAIVEGRSVPAIIGSIFVPVSRKVRALRDRVAGGEAALIQQLGAATPGLANAVAAAVTLGAVAVVGSLLTSDDLSRHVPSQLDLAATTISADPPALRSALSDNASPEPVVVEPSEEPAVVEITPASTPEPAGPPAATTTQPRPSGPDPSVEVDTDEVLPVEDPPASGSAGGGVSSGDDVTKADVQAAADALKDEQGEQDDVSVDMPVFVSCTPSEKQGAVMATACPVLQAPPSS